MSAALYTRIHAKPIAARLLTILRRTATHLTDLKHFGQPQIAMGNINRYLTGILLLGTLLTGLSLAEEAPENTGENPTSAPPAAPSADISTPPPPPANPPERLEVQRGQWLIKQLQSDPDSRIEIHWFREGSAEKYLGLYTPEHSLQPQGYALILHDNQQHPNWPGIVSALRAELPAGGWSTLAISLPDYWLIPDIPKREPEDTVIATTNSDISSNDSSEASDAETTGEAETAAMPGSRTALENTSEAAADPAPLRAHRFPPLAEDYDRQEVPKILQSRIQEGLEFLRDRDPMPIIIIAIGSSATWIAQQAHEMRMKDIAGLVIIDPVKLPDSDTNPNEDVAGLRIPVLDIAPEYNARTPPIERKKNARRQSRKTYEQHIVMGSGPGFSQSEPQVVKKIRGWAKRVILDKSRFGYL